MAKIKNPETTVSPAISAAPVTIKRTGTPATDLNGQTLRGQTIASTLKKPQNSSEQDQAFQAMMAKLLPADQELAKYLERLLLVDLIYNSHDLATPLSSHVLTYEALENKKELTQGEIFNANSNDKRVAETPVIEHIKDDGTRSYYVGSALKEFISLRSSKATTTAAHPPTGVQPISADHDKYKLTSIGDIQRQMHNAIKLAAQATGVPATLLGAMAGKESWYGKNQVSSSGAEGLFQQTDGYLKANYVNNLAQARKIAAVVPEVAEYLQDGKITMAEARKLAWNPAAAAMLTALRAEALAKDFGLDLNKPSSWAYVYTEHNAGRGSLNKLVNGGMTDKWIQDLNPSMYKNANSAKDVLQIAANDMLLWGNRYEKMVEKMNLNSADGIVASAIAKTSASSKANLPNPTREPV